MQWCILNDFPVGGRCLKYVFITVKLESFLDIKKGQCFFMIFKYLKYYLIIILE